MPTAQLLRILINKLRKVVSEKSEIIPCYEFPQGWEPTNYAFEIPTEGPVPPKLREVGCDRFISRKITWASCYVGTYGMGGSGFIGLEIEATERYPQEYLILCLWGATSWVLYNGKQLDDASFVRSKESFINQIQNRTIEFFNVSDDSFKMTLSGGGVFEMSEDPTTREVWAGGPAKGQHRKLALGDSLWDAFVVATTNQIAV